MRFAPSWYNNRMAISDYLRTLRQKLGHDLVLVPGVTALIFNSAGEVLLQRAADDGRWYTIGGAVDPGEELGDAVVREVFEETGLRVAPERVVGVYTDPLVVYPNGDRVIYVSTCFVCRAVGGGSAGALAGDDESLELRYFPVDRLPELLPTHRHRIFQAVKNENRAYFAWNENKT
jgi:8-oxo-dGTP pyrophosphatase MutT (NUDIX family)